VNIYFGQIYIEPGISFPFSHHFQKLLSEEVSRLVPMSEGFKDRYGAEWDVMLRISAKSRLSETEIKGPTVFKKDRSVEYTIFLPFDVICAQESWCLLALISLLDGACSVLDLLSLSSAELKDRKMSIIETFLSDDLIFKGDRLYGLCK
jgi:hypothetical protein